MIRCFGGLSARDIAFFSKFFMPARAFVRTNGQGCGDTTIAFWPLPIFPTNLAHARKNFPKKQCSLASASEISFLSESNRIANQKSTAKFLPGLNEQKICIATDKVRKGIAGRRVRRRGETADNLVFWNARRNCFEHRRIPAGITFRPAGSVKAFWCASSDLDRLSFALAAPESPPEVSEPDMDVRRE